MQKIALDVKYIEHKYREYMYCGEIHNRWSLRDHVSKDSKVHIAPLDLVRMLCHPDHKYLIASQDRAPEIDVSFDDIKYDLPSIENDVYISYYTNQQLFIIRNKPCEDHRCVIDVNVEDVYDLCKKQFDKYETKIQKLQQKILYQPGGEGYTQAQKDFNALVPSSN